MVTIYHIPNICNAIFKYNYDTRQVYYNFWNFNRYSINKINTLGQNVLNNLDKKEIVEFQYYYITYLFSKDNYNYRIMFLNCDNEFNICKLIDSYRTYMNFPSKFIFKIWDILTY